MNKSRVENQIEYLRKQIDQLDHTLMKHLGKRLDKVRKLANLKTEIGLKPLQKARWRTVLKDRVNQGTRHYGLRREFVRSLFELIHREALKIQRGKVK